VHVLGESANESFVYFKFGAGTTKLRCGAKRAIVQSFAEPLKHKPCRLLGDTKSAVNLHTADSVFAVDQHPESGHPFVHPQSGILEDRIYLERELPVAATAEPQFSSLDEVVLFGVTARADNLSIRPAKLNGIVKGAVRIGEINDGLLQSSWRLHRKTIRRLFACVKYIFTLGYRRRAKS